MLALLPALHAAEIGEPGQRFGFGFQAGVGGGLSLKFYATERVAVSATAGFWGLLIRRQALVAEVDVWERAFAKGTVVTTAGFGVAREYDGFWRDTTHLGVRMATGATWRWHGRGFEVGTELGLELYNYDVGRLQFGELPTATVVARWYPRWGG